MRPKFDENTESEAVPTLIRPWSRSKSRQLPCADVVASLGVLAPLRVDQSFASGSRLNSLILSKDSIKHISPHIFGHVSFLRLETPPPNLYVQGAYITQQSGVGAGTAVFTRRSSRLFAVQDQYPPSGFSAYGIVAFPSSMTSDSVNRYKAICEGFVSSILASSELVKESVPVSAQFPTIWPLRSNDLATSLNSSPNVNLDLCDRIVMDIDTTMSAIAVNRAKVQLQARIGDGDFGVNGDGPYLLAWAPGSDFESADDDVLLLQFDLSDVTNSLQAKRVFQFWTEEIERDPGTWERGFNFNRIRLKLMLGADKYGSMILSVAKLFLKQR